MSIGSILNMARTAMAAQQTAVQVASQNISNATTAGYSRQRVDLATTQPTVFPYGSVGTGVGIQSITRSRDALLDTAYRQNSAGAAGADTTNTALSQIQSIFGEPSDSGLSASIDAFWSSWSDLASDPTNSAAKSVVVQTGNNVAVTLNRFGSQLSQLDQDNREGMNAEVGQVNDLSKHIAEFNRQIVSAESGGQPAYDLRDARDRLVDQMSTLVGGQVIEHTNGSIAIYSGGRMLVDDTTVKQLQLNNGQPPSVSYAGSVNPLDGIAGSLGARITVSKTTIPDVMARLDSLASGLVQTVNGIHSAGTVFTGNPPVASAAGNFFDVTVPPPAGGDPLQTARGIRLAPTLTAATVAASGAGATGPGNNTVALSLAALSDQVVTFTSGAATVATTSFSGFYSQAVGEVASSAQQAQDESSIQGTLASNALNRRESVSGVSTDEELLSIIDHQHAYQAAARLVSVVDEMTQVLVTLGQ
ncbi:MAG: flagellar hook-associated protein FlgK [bacterium]